jgi:hypothetical protein
VSKKVIESAADLVTAAFGLIAALAWNSAVQALVGRFVETGSGPMALIIYAILVTVIAVLATVWIGRVREKVGS